MLWVIIRSLFLYEWVIICVIIMTLLRSLLIFWTVVALVTSLICQNWGWICFLLSCLLYVSSLTYAKLDLLPSFCLVQHKLGLILVALIWFHMACAHLYYAWPSAQLREALKKIFGESWDFVLTGWEGFRPIL